jgi:hypothetical protein
MAGFLLGHPGDSAALAALSLRDMLAPDHVVRDDADPAATTIEELGRRFSPATVTEVAAAARPRPEAAPVTSTTLPSIRAESAGQPGSRRQIS